MILEFSFIGIIIVCAVKLHYDKNFTYGATFLTTLGIFFTFVGISMGLWSFDVNNVENSLPSLLYGLRTAFWASTAGVLGALTLKFRFMYLESTNLNNQDSQKNADEVSVKDMIIELQYITSSIVGTEDTSLVSQIKLLRQDTVDNLSALRKSQENILEKFGQSSSEKLVDALNEVIKDFNNKISEQFGDNFRQLNEAVGNLLVWQQEYKEHISNSILINQKTTENMQVSSKAFSDIIENSLSFSKVANELHILIKTTHEQKENLHNMLSSLSNLIIKASDGLPNIERNIISIAEDLSNSVTSNQEILSKSLSENTLLVRQSIQKVGDDFEEINKKFNDQVQKQFSTLELALQKELTDSLNSLGKQLSALSEKFVSDYLPLTERLREIVNISRGI